METTTETPAPPVTTDGVILLTRQQCVDSIAELKLEHCYMVTSGPNPKFWVDPPNFGTTTDITKAAKLTVNAAVNYSSYIQLVDQELAKKIAARKCNAERLLGAQLVGLLKLAPLNPTARAQVMAITRTMPPAEMDTWDKIKDWIESTYDPTSGKAPAPPVTERFEIPVSFSESRSGTCRYSCVAYGNGRFNATEAINDALAEVQTLSELFDFVHSTLIDEAYEQCAPNLDDDNDSYDYSGHRVTDCDGVETQIEQSTNTLKARITDYLRRTQPRDVLERLGIAP